MAHNGVVNKQSIMEYLGINGIYNDTEAALQYIAVKGLYSVDNLEKYTESSLNLIILHLFTNIIIKSMGTKTVVPE